MYILRFDFDFLMQKISLETDLHETVSMSLADSLRVLLEHGLIDGGKPVSFTGGCFPTWRSWGSGRGLKPKDKETAAWRVFKYYYDIKVSLCVCVCVCVYICMACIHHSLFPHRKVMISAIVQIRCYLPLSPSPWIRARLSKRFVLPPSQHTLALTFTFCLTHGQTLLASIRQVDTDFTPCHHRASDTKVHY